MKSFCCDAEMLEENNQCTNCGADGLIKNVPFKKWVKAYHGPFTKKDAYKLMDDLSKSEAICGVKVIARSILKDEYDIYIK